MEEIIQIGTSRIEIDRIWNKEPERVGIDSGDLLGMIRKELPDRDLLDRELPDRN